MNRQKSFENERPTLYLVATPIGNLDEMTYRSINTLKNVKYIAAEDTRNTVKLLNHFEISTKLISHHEHNIKQSIPKLIQLLEEGNDIALVSDAGYPAISDPGYELVKEAIEHEINIVPISGCNACLDALVVSGIAPQPFMFYGFLDHLDKKKKKADGAIYNVPGKGNVTVTYQGKKLFNDEMAFTQFGYTEVLVDGLFDKKVNTRVIFNSTTGGILKIDKD